MTAFSVPRMQPMPSHNTRPWHCTFAPEESAGEWKAGEAPVIIENFGSETPSFYDGFTVKYEHRLRNIC